MPRTALTLVRAFAEFIPGGSEKVEQLVQSGALERAHAWFQQETGARNLTWDRVTGTFAAAWASLQLSDVLHPIDTLQRIVGLFRPLLADLVSFAGAALLKLLELIYEAAMGAGGRRILAILTRARATFVVIIRDPVGFLRNLLGAVAQGVRQFMANILVHLRDGVIAWLTGPVAAAGVQMPERWDLRGIIGFVLQILGLTWARVRGKLVALIGEPAMGLLERGLALINDIRERGLVVALRERVTEFFGTLRDSALGAIRNFIQQRLVMAGITQLLSLLNPVGAIIQAIIKTYTTIQFFIQKINQILDLVESIVNSIAAIASGAIAAAANFVERTMARTIPVVLDFLARFIGLGDVAGQVTTTIRNLQGAVDRMLDRAVEWIRNQARSLASRALGGDPTATPQQRPERGVAEGEAAVNRFAGRRVGPLVLRPLLAAIRIRHQMQALDVVLDGDFWAVEGVVNPHTRRRARAQPESTAAPGAGTGAALDPARLSVGAVIEVRQSRGVADTRTRDPYIWFVAQITRVDTAALRIHYQSANRSRVTTGMLSNADFDVKWVFGHNSQVRISAERILDENDKQRWDDRDMARKVLNYRHHNDQAGTPGKEWEHIIEASAGGDHSSGNLALTTAQINNRLGVLFGQRFSSGDAPPGLPGTDDRPLRQHLAGQSSFVQNRWKQHFYATEFRVNLNWKRSERGIWRELE